MAVARQAERAELELLEADVASIREKLPARREALAEARQSGEAWAPEPGCCGVFAFGMRGFVCIFCVFGCLSWSFIG